MPPPVVALVTCDRLLSAELRRLAAVAGFDVAVAQDTVALAGQWRSAAAVVVDDRELAAACAAGLPRREHVIVVSSAPVAERVWRAAVSLGACAVHHPGADGAEIVDRLRRAVEPSGRGAPVLAVVGGRGGAGASLLAACLAMRAAAAGNGAVALVDVDPAGGGLDVLLGVEGEAGARWPDLAGLAGRVDGERLLDGLPRLGEMRVLSARAADDGDLAPACVQPVLDALCRAAALVVVDLPRHRDRAADVAAAAADSALVVVPAEVRAVASAARQVRALHALGVPTRLVVRQPGPSDLRAEHVAAGLGLPLAATFGVDDRLARRTDRGQFAAALARSPLAGVADRLLDDLPEARAA